MQTLRLTTLFSLLCLVATSLLAQPGVASNDGPEAPPPVEIVFETTQGSFEITLYAEQAPKTVANFLAYVDEGFYDGTIFHRVIPGFVVQGGGFGPGMQKKETKPPIENESANGLKNGRGTLSMARRRDPSSATSQFFINVAYNDKLDARPNRPGYAVFGRVTRGLDVVDRIVALPTDSHGEYRDVPTEDVVVLSAARKTSNANGEGSADASTSPDETGFVAGEHYIELDKRVPTPDPARIEVVEAFSYGCTNCFQMEPLLAGWRTQQRDDVDFERLHAVWSPAMELYARAFYASVQVGTGEAVHLRLFAAIVAEHRRLDDDASLTAFYAENGIDAKAFSDALASPAVAKKVEEAKQRTRAYNLASVPEIVVNGKYRVDPMRAGGRVQIMDVVDFLVERERTLLKP